MSYATQFKQSCIELYNELGDSTVLKEGCGLCYELTTKCVLNNAYSVMSSLLTHSEYDKIDCSNI